MKLVVPYLSRHIIVAILVTLLLAQAVVLAAPCYVWGGTPYACPHTGVSACVQIYATPAITCASGPWTLAQLTSMGLLGTSGCTAATEVFNVPPDNGFSGNQSSGQMDIGDQDYVCLAKKNCAKTVTFLPAPVVFACVLNPLQSCDTITVHNTASGAACPAGTGP